MRTDGTGIEIMDLQTPMTDALIERRDVPARCNDARAAALRRGRQHAFTADARGDVALAAPVQHEKNYANKLAKARDQLRLQ